jgi:hypothetical protein
MIKKNVSQSQKGTGLGYPRQLAIRQPAKFFPEKPWRADIDGIQA